MKRLLLAVLIVSLTTPGIYAQSRRQAARTLARTGRLPVKLSSPTKPARPAPVVKLPTEIPDHLLARRQNLKARKAAQKQRMYHYQAARAKQEEKLYQDWHERYLADTPVREQYYKALSNAYLAERARAYERSAYANLEAAAIWHIPQPVYYHPFYSAYGGVYFLW